MYEPEVDDYVVWDQGEYGYDEGWVYFKCDEISHDLKGRPHARYCSVIVVRLSKNLVLLQECVSHLHLIMV